MDYSTLTIQDLSTSVIQLTPDFFEVYTLILNKMGFLKGSVEFFLAGSNAMQDFSRNY